MAAAKLHKKGAAGKAPLTATASVDEWFDASSSEDDGESSSKTVSKSAASTTGSRAGTRRGKEWQKVALPSVSMDGYSAKRKSLPATTTGKVESGENDESAAVEDKENVEMLAEDEAAVDYDDNADVGDDEGMPFGFS